MESKIHNDSFLESIYYGADQAIFVIDLTEDGDFCFAGINPAHEKMTGMVSDEIRGKLLDDLGYAIPQEALKEIRNRYENCVRLGSTYEYEEMIPILGKKTHWITRLTPLRDETGRIFRMIGSATDITHKAEEQARTREQFLASMDDRENTFRSIVENMQDMAYRLDSQWIPRFLFGKIEELTGYTEQELMTGSIAWQDLVHPEDQAALAKTHGTQNFSKAGKTVRREYRLLRKDGGIRWVSDYTQILAEGREGELALQGVISDVTHWKEVQQIVLETETRYNLITQSINLGLWDWHVGKEETFYDRTWKEQLGYKENELENKFSVWEKLLHPDDRAGMLKAVQDYLDHPQGMFLAEFRLRHKDGSYRWISNRAASLLDNEGKVQRMFGAHSDITRRKEDETKIRKSELRYRSLFENAKDMIHIVDTDGRIINVNRTELQTLGYQKEEMVGCNFMDFIDREHLDNNREKFQLLQEGGSADRYETILRSKSGQQIIAQVSLVPDIIDGEMVTACAILSDVTELRRANKELARTNEELIEKNREMEQIVYVTSHDLRSPLVNIQGFNQELVLSIQDLKNSLEQLDLPEDLSDEINLVMNHEIPESLDFIKTSIIKMDSLLKGLLSISRLGRRPLEIKHIKMDDMIGSIIKSTFYEASEKGIQISYDELPDFAGDENQMNQVFSNLIDNAIKFMDVSRKGLIHISGAHDKERIIYKIKDNGIGIPLEKQEKIFEIFHKHEPGKPGEGLGLTIVRKIVEKHHGRINVESKPGEGSCFIVSMPGHTKTP